jgi:hypothetical protein
MKSVFEINQMAINRHRWEENFGCRAISFEFHCQYVQCKDCRLIDMIHFHDAYSQTEVDIDWEINYKYLARSVEASAKELTQLMYRYHDPQAKLAMKRAAEIVTYNLNEKLKEDGFNGKD